MLKAFADLQATAKLSLDLGMVALSSAYARGNENNLHQADGLYYLGPGTSPGYAVLNFGARYQVHRRLQLFVQVNNLLDRRYYTAAQLGPTAFTGSGTFIARPFPAVGADFPVQHATFRRASAAGRAWGGIRIGDSEGRGPQEEGRAGRKITPLPSHCVGLDARVGLSGRGKSCGLAVKS